MSEEVFPREIADKIFWINQCMGAGSKDHPVHLHLSLFLLRGDNHTMLVDTSMQALWPSIELQLDRVLAGRTLDYLFVTHPELPHSAALPLLLKKYPDMKVVGDMRDYHVFFPEHAHRFHHKVPADVMDLGDLKVTFIDGVIKDLPGTLWAYESTRQAMFVCDGFSFTHESPVRLDPQGLSIDGQDFDDDDEDAPYHAPGDCALTSSEITGGIDVDKATYLLTRALYFARFVDADKLFADIEGTFFENWPTKLVCPSHGNVIDNLDAVTPIIKQSHVNAHKIATAEKKPSIAAPR
jgi:glyoxylase-like metal-dependent hydrolase (beta-lactamase superfamily II)